MKLNKHRILTATFLAFIFTSFVTAQTIDEAIKYSLTQPTGTARSIALGGAMGALGGDYSAITINPAGIAVYRSSEFSFTPSLIFNQTDSWYDRAADNISYSSNTASSDKFSFPVNQISYVGTLKSMREIDRGVVSSHFAIGYNRTQNYNRETFIQGNNIQSSFLDEFVDIANNSGLTPFYTQLAYNAFLLDPVSEDENNGYFNAFEYLDNGTPLWGPDNGLNQRRVIDESGYSGDFNITYGINISNKLLLGGTLSLATLNYEKKYEHYEEVAPSENQWTYLNNYSFSENLSTNGTGINLKLGAIFKPINSVRIGASFKTPTFYSINEEYWTEINIPKSFADQNTEGKTQFESDYGDYSYNFRTPYQATGSFAYIFGTKGLISIDYEYTDFANMNFKSKQAVTNDITALEDLNNQISDVYKPTHNIRIGAEYKLLPTIALRAGAASFQSPYKNQLIINKEDGTSEKFDFENEKYDITGGIGFMHQNMSIDISYLYRNISYINSLYYAPHVSDESQYPAKITSTDHQLAVTLGWRF
ncbi:OmpP1/FadL family transporter [Marinilabilia rubra]|uniref:Hydrocarbon degradation protein n=1 Tax=Marinilabilia rubra TaxID=2162893 RepID=A0A2U2BCK9_9BACT|nr:outer membrane protein transport protein [Marinilabilia rubra]PWE00798.1 hydrocarbon degradation protein [Marinilabilia rubra]